MQNEQLTLEEFLILLDAADTQLTNEAARVIRELKRDLEIAQDNACKALAKIHMKDEQ